MVEQQPTRAEDVLLPVEVVELKHLVTRSGEPVRVLCGGVDEVVIQAVMRVLPGAHPPAFDDGEQGAGAGESEAYAESLKRIAVPLLEAGTAFSDGNGGEVRPAFYWDPAKRVPGSIPGRLLRLEDIDRLVTATLRAGGYVAPAAGGGPEDGSFHGGERGGAPVRVEPVPTGEGVGSNPVGHGARPAPRVQRRRAESTR